MRRKKVMTGKRQNGRKSQTPRAERSRRQMVRLVGKATNLRPRERAFDLHLDDGSTVRCVLVEGDWKSLEKLKGRRTVVEGMAIWPMKGPLLRLECDWVASGRRERSLWSHLPPTPSHAF